MRWLSVCNWFIHSQESLNIVRHVLNCFYLFEGPTETDEQDLLQLDLVDAHSPSLSSSAPDGSQHGCSSTGVWTSDQMSNQRIWVLWTLGGSTDRLLLVWRYQFFFKDQASLVFWNSSWRWSLLPRPLPELKLFGRFNFDSFQQLQNVYVGRLLVFEQRCLWFSTHNRRSQRNAFEGSPFENHLLE